MKYENKNPVDIPSLHATMMNMNEKPSEIKNMNTKYMVAVDYRVVVGTMGVCFGFMHPIISLWLVPVILYGALGYYVLNALKRENAIKVEAFHIGFTYLLPWAVLLMGLATSDSFAKIVKDDCKVFLSNKYYSLRWPVVIHRDHPENKERATK